MDGGSESAGSDSAGSDSETGGECFTCINDAQCCDAASPPAGIPGSCGTYPNVWTCVQGHCVNEGCTNNADCVIETHLCLPINGVRYCFAPCASDSQCEGELSMQGTTCSGVADNGVSYCR
jgi:hypothetical protein